MKWTILPAEPEAIVGFFAGDDLNGVEELLWQFNNADKTELKLARMSKDKGHGTLTFVRVEEKEPT